MNKTSFSVIFQEKRSIHILAQHGLFVCQGKQVISYFKAHQTEYKGLRIRL